MRKEKWGRLRLSRTFSSQCRGLGEKRMKTSFHHWILQLSSKQAEKRKQLKNPQDKDCSSRCSLAVPKVQNGRKFPVIPGLEPPPTSTPGTEGVLLHPSQLCPWDGASPTGHSWSHCALQLLWDSSGDVTNTPGGTSCFPPKRF